jgi:cytochrome c553
MRIFPALVRCSLILGLLLAVGCSDDGGTTPSGTTGGGGSSVVASGFPCEVDEVLNVCRNCHSNPTKKAAPFPLVKYEDIQKNYLNKPITEQMKKAVETDFMPLSPSTLSSEQKKTLLDWLSQGAPKAADGISCNPPS